MPLTEQGLNLNGKTPTGCRSKINKIADINEKGSRKIATGKMKEITMERHWRDRKRKMYGGY
jgi:hypothetical protein